MSGQNVQLKVSEILQHLKDGLTREDIGEKYGLNGAQVKRLFLHPKLKFKKTISKKEDPFVLEDDTEETSTATVAEDAADDAAEIPTGDTAQLELPLVPSVVEEPASTWPTEEASAEVVAAEEAADAHTQFGMDIQD